MAINSDNDLDLRSILRASNAAADASSEVLLARFRTDSSDPLDTFYKSPNALVTDADLASDHVISETLDAVGAPGRILSEESDTVLSGDESLTWLVDPLCGTVPFSTGMNHWGVNIALRRRDELVAASMPLPAVGLRLSASKGGGAICNNRPIEAVSPREKLSESTINLEIDGPDEWRKMLQSGLEWIPSVSQINTFASIAYPLGLMCLGRIPAGVYYGVEPVHFAAGAMIATEVGLEVTDNHGEAIDWSEEAELPVVVIGWPNIHAQLLEAMSS